jgi:ABC-type multidrug transport system ATPase subunit
MNSQPYLQVLRLTKRYGSICALGEVDFALERGNVLAVLGPNGAGKSTFFGCLLRLAWPTSGWILKEGKPIDEFDAAEIGYVPERVALYPHRTVEENAVFFAALKGHSVEEVERQLDRVGLLAVSKRKVRQLSKGMLQRLGLAIALCGEPELMVLDEPFNGLDPALLETLQSILREERERGATLLVSTHTISAVEPLATHVAILLQGKLAAFDELETLREQNDFDSLESLYGRIARSSRTREEVLA